MTNRNAKIPRHFAFESIGEGDIVEEATVEYENWAPAIQFLRFTEGESACKEVLRFCYYVDSGQLANRALWIDDNDVENLKEDIKKRPQVRRFLQRLLE